MTARLRQDMDFGMRSWGLVVGALLLVAGCKSGPTEQYPPEMVDNFMRGCTARSEPETCRCALDKLQDQFSADELKGFESRMSKGDVPKEMVDATSSCR